MTHIHKKTSQMPWKHLVSALPPNDLDLVVDPQKFSVI